MRIPSISHLGRLFFLISIRQVAVQSAVVMQTPGCSKGTFRLNESLVISQHLYLSSLHAF